MLTREYKLILRHLYPSIFIVLTLLLLLGGAIYMIQKVLHSRSEIVTLQNEVADLNKKTAALLPNSTVSKNDLDQYTQMLTQLIPENEDFFSVLKALENLSAQTGYTVVQYQINPSQTVSEKLTLQIQGIGDATAFLNFLNNYSFGGGRYTTSDLVLFNDNNTDTSTINLTFYSHKTSSLSEVNKSLTQKDIALLKKIQSKTIIMVKDTSSDTQVQEYTTKSNPF